MEEMGSSRLLQRNSVVAHGVQVDICSTYGSAIIFLSGDRQLGSRSPTKQALQFTITYNGITYLHLFTVCGCFSSVSLLSCKPAGSSLYNKQHTSRAQCQTLRDLGQFRSAAITQHNSWTFRCTAHISCKPDSYIPDPHAFLITRLKCSRRMLRAFSFRQAWSLWARYDSAVSHASLRSCRYRSA